MRSENHPLQKLHDMNETQQYEVVHWMLLQDVDPRLRGDDDVAGGGAYIKEYPSA